MLRIYDTALQVVREVVPLLEQIGRHDRDLERQLRRALTSVPLNLAEGSYSAGGNRRARYHTAAGSMREVIAGLEVAQALGYLGKPSRELSDAMRAVHLVAAKNAAARV